MISAIEKARKQHKAAVEQLYEDRCTVYELRSVRDEQTKITKKQEVAVYEDLPCKLSFESLSTTTGEAGAAEQAVSVKLFLSPEVDVKPGSKIAFTHDGNDTAYSASGIPGEFVTHQEIMLEIFDRWA